MLRFAGYRKAGQPIRIAWKKATNPTPMKEQDFFAKGRSLCLSIPEAVQLVQVLQQGVKAMIAEERAKAEREAEVRGDQQPTKVALPDGLRTPGGIVLPPGVTLDD